MSLLEECIHSENCVNTKFFVNVIKRSINLPGYTRITFIPQYYFQPRIVEQLAMGVPELVYNIGGTIGMWIGVSVLSVTALMFYLQLILSKLYKYIQSAPVIV